MHELVVVLDDGILEFVLGAVVDEADRAEELLGGFNDGDLVDLLVDVDGELGVGADCACLVEHLSEALELLLDGAYFNLRVLLGDLGEDGVSLPHEHVVVEESLCHISLPNPLLDYSLPGGRGIGSANLPG